MNQQSSLNDSKGKKETPGDIRKQKKRIEESRDSLKEKNREKRIQIKAQLGKVDDLKISRDLWRHRSEEYAKKINQLNQALEKEQQTRIQREAYIQEQECILAQHIQSQQDQEKEYEAKINELKKKLK